MEHDTPSRSLLDEGPTQPSPTVPDPDQLPPIMTVDELAFLLRVNRKTVYDAIAANEIPGVRRVGKTIRISRDVVVNWLQGEGRVSSSRRTR